MRTKMVIEGINNNTIKEERENRKQRDRKYKTKKRIFCS
jgi:hypothetical protein